METVLIAIIVFALIYSSTRSKPKKDFKDKKGDKGGEGRGKK